MTGTAGDELAVDVVLVELTLAPAGAAGGLYSLLIPSRCQRLNLTLTATVPLDGVEMPINAARIEGVVGEDSRVVVMSTNKR